MKVKATKKGFYGKLRRVGDEFKISKKEDLGSWMKEIKPVKAEQSK
jgi:hypothetical protein